MAGIYARRFSWIPRSSRGMTRGKTPENDKSGQGMKKRDCKHKVRFAKLRKSGIAKSEQSGVQIDAGIGFSFDCFAQRFGCVFFNAFARAAYDKIDCVLGAFFHGVL